MQDPLERALDLLEEALVLVNPADEEDEKTQDEILEFLHDHNRLLMIMTLSEIEEFDVKAQQTEANV